MSDILEAHFHEILFEVNRVIEDNQAKDERIKELELSRDKMIRYINKHLLASEPSEAKRRTVRKLLGITL